MPGEDQERFEDYLELEHFIEELQAGHVAHPPDELAPEQARIYRMAALFRSASPEAATPRPEFVAELQAQLEQELQQPPRKRLFPFIRRQPQKAPRVSRRALLAGGAAAAVAASLGIGAGLDHIVEEANKPTPSWPPLVPPEAASTWHPVATLAELGDKAVPFATGTIVGYVIRDDGDNGDPDKGKIIAMSAACTHMGCIVQWNDSDRKFHCPCHGGVFTEYGKLDNSSSPRLYLNQLPRLETKVEDGRVYVRVPLTSQL